MPITTRGKAAGTDAPEQQPVEHSPTKRGGRPAPTRTAETTSKTATRPTAGESTEKTTAHEGKSPVKKRARHDSEGDVEVTAIPETPSSRRSARRPPRLAVAEEEEQIIVQDEVYESTTEVVIEQAVDDQHPGYEYELVEQGSGAQRMTFARNHNAGMSPSRRQPARQQHFRQQQQQRDEAGGEEAEEGDGPPRLTAEDGPTADEMMMTELIERGAIGEDGYYDQNVIRVQSPGGTQQFIQLAPGQDLEGLPEGTVFMEESEMGADGEMPADLRTVEFNFLDNKNICCGLCGEIVPYELLMSEHLPQMHPEVLGDGTDMHMEEIPYEDWLREKLRAEKRAIESGFKMTSFENPARIQHQRPLTNRVHRRVSQIRVNPLEMSLQQLDTALKRKMVEKMGRKVPVTLVDKQHARCGLCNAVVSLNKKFEVVHLVRHFNAWHPSAHRCAGTWNKNPSMQPGQRPGAKPLSSQDFAVIDASLNTPDNLQCIWCGMFMDTDSLAMHFDEVHPDDIEVPKCNLCLQELVINARIQEKFGDDFEVTLPDEHHLRCGKYSATFNSEAALEKGIEKRLKRGDTGAEGEERDGDEDADEAGPEAFLNSRMSLGRRKKPKRQFIMPALRQAAPIDSQYVEPVNECQWKCKMCNQDILAAVISAGAIRHYRTVHPEHLDAMQYELCKARLERVSDGCMEFVHPQLIECLMCNMTYNLHRPYNMCRAIRHLKAKHPNLMPEYAGVSTVSHGNKTIQVPKLWKKKGQQRGATGKEAVKTSATSSGKKKGAARRLPPMQPVNEAVTDPATLEMLKAQFGDNLDKVQAVRGADGEPVYVLMPEGEEMDEATAEQLAAALATGEIEGEEMDDDQLEEEDDEDEDDDDEEEISPVAKRRLASQPKIEPMPTRRSTRLRQGHDQQPPQEEATTSSSSNPMPNEILAAQE